MIEIIGGVLFQWDTGRSVKVTGTNASHIHFANPGDTKAVAMQLDSEELKIPDYLFQTGKQLCVYAVLDGVTVEKKVFHVTKRERPEHYVYEDDQRNYIFELVSMAEKAADEAVSIAEDLRDALDRGEFVGPKGDAGPAGPAGPQGPQGPQGPKGNDGTMTFEDLTDEQKASLKGEKGDRGPQGIQGVQGIQGIQGEPGEKGEKGDTGAAGYSPVRGTDYWTASDIAEIKSYVDEAILGGAW